MHEVIRRVGRFVEIQHNRRIEKSNDLPLVGSLNYTDWDRLAPKLDGLEKVWKHSKVVAPQFKVHAAACRVIAVNVNQGVGRP